MKITKIAYKVLSIILVVFFGIQIVLLIASFVYSCFGTYYFTDLNMYTYYIDQGDYVALLESIDEQDVQYYLETEERTEYYAIAKYFEAASWYHVYENQDSEKSMKYMENMEYWNGFISTFSYARRDINEIFQIESQ